MNNPGFVITNKGVVVIDPGSTLYTGRMVLRQIKKLTNKPVTHVLNTHIHGDHWLGNQAFKESYPNAVFMAHPDMIKAAKGGEGKAWVNMMERFTEGLSKGTKAVIPAKAVSDTNKFTSGGISFVIYAPGKAHSGTDIMIHVVEESVVFLGDNVLSKRLPRLDDATYRGGINACEVAIKIGAKHYVPGHGISSSAAMVATYKQYLTTVYTQASELYEEGLSDFEMKPQIVKKLSAYKDWRNFEEVGKHISLAVLEAEKAAFE